MNADQQLGSELRKAVLPIVATDADGNARVLGSGFIIVADGRRAQLVTAAHVVREIRRTERPRERHNLTTPRMFIPIEHRFELRHTDPFALYHDPARGSCRAIIDGFLELEDADLALCSIRFEDDVPADFRFAQFPIDTRPPEVGEAMVALGYAKGEAERTSDDQAEPSWSFRADWRRRSGEVIEVFPTQGPTGQKGACFLCSATFDPGMSGGPVITADEEGKLIVRGVVMSDQDFWASEDPGVPTALASMIWQILLMPVSIPNEDGNIVGRTLADLAREGVIRDRGHGHNHVQVVRNDNGQIDSARWV